MLDLPSDVTDTILDFLLEVSEKRDLSLGVQPRLDEHITPATVQRWRRESYSTSASVLDLGAGGLADGINSLQADGGTGERLLEHFVSIRGEGSRAPPMWGLLSLSLETSSCVIYTFFQRSGNRERYAVVIRGVICGLS